MTIRDWDGVALIIGAGDIGKCISEYLTVVSPNLDVIVCGRNPTNKNDIYLDLEDDQSFTFFENQIALFRKPIRLVINTSGFTSYVSIKFVTTGQSSTRISTITPALINLMKLQLAPKYVKKLASRYFRFNHEKFICLVKALTY